MTDINKNVKISRIIFDLYKMSIAVICIFTNHFAAAQ